MSWVTIDATAIRSFIGRYLDPDDILGEVLFGLIMTLGFTLGAGLIVKGGKGCRHSDAAGGRWL